MEVPLGHFPFWELVLLLVGKLGALRGNGQCPERLDTCIFCVLTNLGLQALEFLNPGRVAFALSCFRPASGALPQAPERTKFYLGTEVRVL